MKARKKQIIALLVCLSLLLGGCLSTPAQLVSSEIEITYSEETFTPLSWHVPGGEKITLKAVNDSDQEWHWILMAQPVTLPFDEDDWQKTLAEFTISPQSEETFTFTAPQAAGEYDIVCNLDLTEEEPGPVGTLIVYRVRELTTTPY